MQQSIAQWLRARILDILARCVNLDKLHSVLQFVHLQNRDNNDMNFIWWLYKLNACIEEYLTYMNVSYYYLEDLIQKSFTKNYKDLSSLEARTSESRTDVLDNLRKQP